MVYILKFKMGVKNLFKVITPTQIISQKDFERVFEGKTIAIDAMLELNRCLKAGMKSLTNSQGEYTHQYKIILSFIIQLERMHVKQIWVFDYDTSQNPSTTHYKDKEEELERRRKRMDKYKAKSEEIEAFINMRKEAESLVQNASDEQKILIDQLLQKVETKDELKDKKSILDRRSRSVHNNEIKNLQKMLDYLGVMWLESPEGFEAEHIASCLSQENYVDYVYTADSDALVYGAKNLIRKVSAKEGDKKIKNTCYQLYDLDEIHKRYKIDQLDLIKIAVCLGTENKGNFNGISGIGPDGVLKKFRSVAQQEYDRFKDVFIKFGKQCISKLNINNANSKRFTRLGKKNLTDWLVNDKEYKESTVNSILSKLPISQEDLQLLASKKIIIEL
jgi:5'-3' exonuclease